MYKWGPEDNVRCRSISTTHFSLGQCFSVTWDSPSKLAARLVGQGTLEFQLFLPPQDWVASVHHRVCALPLSLPPLPFPSHPQGLNGRMLQDKHFKDCYVPSTCLKSNFHFGLHSGVWELLYYHGLYLATLYVLGNIVKYLAVS